MRFACNYAVRMPKHLQVRDVPDNIHRKLKARAALEGRSLSDYVLDELRIIVNRPTMEELKKRIAELEPVDLGGESIVEAIQAARDERDEQISKWLS